MPGHSGALAGEDAAGAFFKIMGAARAGVLDAPAGGRRADAARLSGALNAYMKSTGCGKLT
ncbi:hypothetical protein FOZ76_01660 [Verticiella sediminum]|uniref:Uncharacterized protein n=1 Tax=Verticiella sediminum TaxID=1247510 RepID=A0A556B0X2_9BURK|nr:hypothetical protein [Verticiella sediminum]TSH98848.1 hypothetical protein FOZ76_01660 [Verticiella sediminum]